MGVVVDAVSSVIDLQASQIEPAPDLGESTRFRYVIGMGKVDQDLVILLDIAATLSPQEMEQAQAIAA